MSDTKDSTSTSKPGHIPRQIPRVIDGGPSPEGVSLAAELDMVRYAMGGSRILAEALQHGEGSAHDERETLNAIPAILTLLGLRVHRLSRVATGQLDAADIMAPHNKVPAGFDVHTEDIVIPVGRRARAQ